MREVHISWWSELVNLTGLACIFCWKLCYQPVLPFCVVGCTVEGHRGSSVCLWTHTPGRRKWEREREREFEMRCEEEWRRNDEQLLSASFCCEQKVCRRRYGLSDERPRRKNERRKCVHCLKNGEQRMIRIVLWMKPETGQYVNTVNWRSSKKVDRKEETKIVSCLLTVTAWLWERREISCNLRFPVSGQSCSQDHEKEG